MRRASGVIRPATTDQREARVCKEERGRGRQALPSRKVECAFCPDSQYLHHTATPICCMLDTQGR